MDINQYFQKTMYGHMTGQQGSTNSPTVVNPVPVEGVNSPTVNTIHSNQPISPMDQLAQYLQAQQQGQK